MGITTAVATALAVSAETAGVIVAVAETAISLGVSALLAPHPRAGTAPTPQPIPFAFRGTEDRLWVYGRSASSGSVEYL